MTTTEEECETCGNTRTWHEDFKPHHPFVARGGTGAGKLNKKPDKGKAQQANVRPAAGLAGDPALRIALVRAGVIKYEDIIMAEEELRVASQSGRAVVIEGPTDRGDGPSLPNDRGSAAEDLRSGGGGGSDRGVRDPGERDPRRKGRQASKSS